MAISDIRLTKEQRKKEIARGDCDFECAKKNRKDGCGCERCVAYRGYFRADEVRPDKKFWNDETGFLGIDGCRLPRELRSDVCLGFNCKG